MNEFNNTVRVRSVSMAEANSRFMSRVYGWMTGGLLLTAVVASYIGQSSELLEMLMMNRGLFIGLIIAQIALVVGLSAALTRLSPAVATALYLLYAVMTGVTLSALFMVYTSESIANIFIVTAMGFAGLSLFGISTKRDLGPVGAFCGMALFGLVGFAIVSMFFTSLNTGAMQTVYSIGGLLVFSGLTAYDTQKLKNLNAGGLEGTDDHQRLAIHGALTLYLDFINLFINLLRLFGDRRN